MRKSGIRLFFLRRSLAIFLFFLGWQAVSLIVKHPGFLSLSAQNLTFFKVVNEFSRDTIGCAGTDILPLMHTMIIPHGVLNIPQEHITQVVESIALVTHEIKQFCFTTDEGFHKYSE